MALSRRVERILQRLFDVKTYSFIYFFSVLAYQGCLYRLAKNTGV